VRALSNAVRRRAQRAEPGAPERQVVRAP
jgi:hypothetical protein